MRASTLLFWDGGGYQLTETAGRVLDPDSLTQVEGQDEALRRWFIEQEHPHFPQIRPRESTNLFLPLAKGTSS
ncbi:hypothetical protein LXG23DRAFT_51057 [Yarrowia lipolytica]|uniref:Uncharacterized protein n=1 Tax=Yarrowia lipolytica TaxID=4952 RepID=A0A1D8N430_YARLL|nr:hypothetical protein YALI1_A08049g [Yarrowia lipolytica]KAB8281740.1 hypothetical protein BKA91DRAFT_86664 [Yarrowia lipolytica]KAE8169131.1 hypothetical protein BKA90DRAFT_90520 [Yarrowia lipolytica]KAJ8051477.1 hypothetical protein LXG23DRAFT_51057 [Yarrowia lipolytica]RMI97156.1 hypothetical protein BD777DRAFT_88547 [Yarrowia lipolytica]